MLSMPFCPDKFPTRESFANMIEREFNRGDSKVKVSHWACCREPHKEEGEHYHCAIKLNGQKKWYMVRENIKEIYDIDVDFSDKHDYYLSAYNYVTKEDPNYVLSEGHPNLENAKSPPTKKCIAACKRKSSASSSKEGPSSSSSASGNARKRLRLTKPEVGMFIRRHNIHTYDELLATADDRLEDGLSDLSDFVYNNREETLKGLIRKAWDMAAARKNVESSKNRDRFDLLLKYRHEEDCVCNGLWLTCAREVLQLNNIDEKVFTTALLNNIKLGRAKFRNILLIGEADCAKTFLLKPLATIYGNDLFENPASHKYGWGNAANKTVMLLQDFRWSSDLIAWKDLLLLLEGETVKLPAPRNFFKDDICIRSEDNVAIFATSVDVIKYKGSYNVRDTREDDMMASRWKVFRLYYKFAEEKQIKVKPCGNCFANFVMPSEN